MLKDRLLKAFGGLIALATIAFASLPDDALGVSASNEFAESGSYTFFSSNDIASVYNPVLTTCTSSQSNWSLPYGERYSYIPQAISFTYSNGAYTLDSVTILSCAVNMFYSTSVDYFFTRDIPFGVYIETGYPCFQLGCRFEPVSYSGETYSFSWLTWDTNWCIPSINCYTPASVPSGFYMPWSFLDSFFVSGPTPWITSNARLFDTGYGDGYSDGLDDGGAYTLSVYNDSSLAHVVHSTTGSDYIWGATPSFPGTSFVVGGSGSPIRFSPGKNNVFYVQYNADYMDFKLNVGFGSGRTYEIDCVSHGASIDDPICLPYWEGNLSLHIIGTNTPTPGYVMRQTFFAVGQDYLHGVECGMTYQRGYDDGYNAAITTDNGIYIQWDTDVYNTDRTYTVSWYDSGNKVGSATLSYYNTLVYFERPYGHSYTWTITPNVSIPFTITYSASGTGGSVSSVLTSDMAVDNLYYLPFWEGSITLKVTPDSSTYGSISSYEFKLTNDSSSIQYVKIGYGYSVGYAKGYSDGQDAANAGYYVDGYLDGAANGSSEGYNNGYSDGYAHGYIEGGDGGSIEVIDIWPLLSAVITMPFTFFSTGLDWTLFQGTPYEFGVSAFFGSLLVILMLWKIIQLIMGFGK